MTVAQYLGFGLLVVAGVLALVFLLRALKKLEDDEQHFVRRSRTWRQ